MCNASRLNGARFLPGLKLPGALREDMLNRTRTPLPQRTRHLEQTKCLAGWRVCARTQTSLRWNVEAFERRR